MNNKDVIVYTFGCRMNTFESNCIQEMMSKLGMKNFIVVNSCAITAEAERQVRQKIRKLKRENPDYYLILTGCSGQAHYENYLKMIEVDFLVGNSLKLKEEVYDNINNYVLKHCKVDKNNIEYQKLQQTLLSKTKNNVVINDKNKLLEKQQCIDDNDWNYIYHFEDRSRAFVPIQTGCNHFCSFCIVPFTRGTFLSYNAEHIINQIKIFVKNGYNEVVLTGIDITDYGKDVRGKTDIDTLGKLCKEIFKKTTITRLRLSSVDAAEIDEDILDLVANEKRFMPYFHISLQSGSNSVLKRMRRRHTKEHVYEFCNKVLKMRPETAFGADIITGFPDETENEFQESVELVKNIPITFVHAFPYSRRERTLAYLMNDNVEKKIKKERVNTLIKLGEENLIKMFKTMDNTIQTCLIEHNNIARCENFIKVQVDKKRINTLKIGSIVDVKCILKQDKLIAVDVII